MRKLFLITAFLLALVWIQPYSYATETTAKKILILHSDEEYIPANIDINATLVPTLKSKASGPLVIFSEYLDSIRFPDRQSYEAHLKNLSQRYAALKPDLIIAIDSKAYRFVMDDPSLQSLNIPVVFCMLPKSALENGNIPPNVTGNYMNVDINGTLDMINAIHPDTKSVFIIAGSGTADLSKLLEIKQAMMDHDYPFKIDFVQGKTIEAFENFASSRKAGEVLVYLSIFEDSNGKKFIPREALKRLSDISTAPIFGLFYTNMDYGLVGGSLFEFKQVALDAAQRSIAILDGTKPSEMPPTFVSNIRYMNFPLLSKWGIRLNQIPEGVEIHNRVFTPWELYAKEIISAAVLFIAMLLLVAALIIQLQLKKQAQSKLIDLNENLESLILQRTIDLEQKNIELSLAQQELINTEKHSVVQHLVRNLLHRVNTPLGVSISYIDVLMELIKDISSSKDYTELPMALEPLQRLMINQTRIRSIMDSLERSLLIHKDEDFSTINLGEMIDSLKMINTATYPGFDKVILLCYPENDVHVQAKSLQAAIQCLIDYCRLSREETPHLMASELSLIHSADHLEIYYQDESFYSLEQFDRIFDPYAMQAFKNDASGLELTIFYNIINICLSGSVEIITMKDQNKEDRLAIKAAIPI